MVVADTVGVVVGVVGVSWSNVGFDRLRNFFTGWVSPTSAVKK